MPDNGGRKSQAGQKPHRRTETERDICIEMGLQKAKRHSEDQRTHVEGPEPVLHGRRRAQAIRLEAPHVSQHLQISFPAIRWVFFYCDKRRPQIKN